MNNGRQPDAAHCPSRRLIQPSRSVAGYSSDRHYDLKSWKRRKKFRYEHVDLEDAGDHAGSRTGIQDVRARGTQNTRNTRTVLDERYLPHVRTASKLHPPRRIDLMRAFSLGSAAASLWNKSSIVMEASAGVVGTIVLEVAAA